MFGDKDPMYLGSKMEIKLPPVEMLVKEDS